MTKKKKKRRKKRRTQTKTTAFQQFVLRPLIKILYLNLFNTVII